jgi:hypothetical protein
MYTIGTAAEILPFSMSREMVDFDFPVALARTRAAPIRLIRQNSTGFTRLCLTTDNGSSNGQSNDSQPRNFDAGTGGLEGELQQLRERLTSLELEREREREQLSDQIEDLRRRLDLADDERRDKDRQLTALLTDQRPQQQPEQPRARGCAASCIV